VASGHRGGDHSKLRREGGDVSRAFDGGTWRDVFLNHRGKEAGTLRTVIQKGHTEKRGAMTLLWKREKKRKDWESERLGSASFLKNYWVLRRRTGTLRLSGMKDGQTMRI